jgi:hypothetical protein
MLIELTKWILGTYYEEEDYAGKEECHPKQ